jgi:polysaccharide biosynthesis protein PslE
LGETPESLPTQQTNGYPNVASDSLQADFYKLRLTLEDLESRLGQEHPKVVDARRTLTQASSMLQATELDRTQSTVSLHPSRQALDLEWRHEETLNASLRAKADALKTQLAVLEQRTRDLNEREVQISDLERQVLIAETSYRSYMENLEQARIGEALEVKRISNLNVVQPPSLVQTPVSPKASLILGAGLMLALCGSVCLALGSEYLDNSIKTPEDVESELGVPVLAAVERMPRRNGNGVAHSRF